MRNNFGEKIYQLRKQKNMTLMSLASKAGVSHVQISNLEKGKCKPSSMTILKLSNALEVDYDYLFNESLK